MDGFPLHWAKSVPSTNLGIAVCPPNLCRLNHTWYHLLPRSSIQCSSFGVKDHKWWNYMISCTDTGDHSNLTLVTRRAAPNLFFGLLIRTLGGRWSRGIPVLSTLYICAREFSGLVQSAHLLTSENTATWSPCSGNPFLHLKWHRSFKGESWLLFK